MQDILKDIRTKVYIENKKKYFEEIAIQLESHGYRKIKINTSNEPDRFMSVSSPGWVSRTTGGMQYETDADYLRVAYRDIFLDITLTTNGWQMAAGIPSGYYGFPGTVRTVSSFIKRVEKDYQSFKDAYDKWYAERGSRQAKDLGIM